MLRALLALESTILAVFKLAGIYGVSWFVIATPLFFALVLTVLREERRQ